MTDDERPEDHRLFGGYAGQLVEIDGIAALPA